MSPAEAELAYRAALRALPDFRFGRDQLVHVLRILPPPPPDAPVAWRHAYLQGIIEEVRALDPRGPLEARLVVQIIVVRHTVADSARRCLDPALTARQVGALHRCEEELLRVIRSLERSLNKRRAERGALGQAPDEAAFDVAALDAVWCGTDPQAPVPGGDAAGLRSGGDAGADGASPAVPRAVWQQAAAPAPVELVKYTMCGQRVDQVRLATMPAAGTA